MPRLGQLIEWGDRGGVSVALGVGEHSWVDDRGGGARNELIRECLVVEAVFEGEAQSEVVEVPALVPRGADPKRPHPHDTLGSGVQNRSRAGREDIPRSAAAEAEGADHAVCPLAGGGDCRWLLDIALADAE